MRRPLMPRRGDLRGALPGLLVMVLIATAGYFVARGVGELLPDDFLESAPWEDVDVEDIVLDPTTGLPVVPTSLSDEVATWRVVQPNSRIDAAKLWASDVPDGTTDPERPAVTLMATYPTHEEAVAVAEGLAQAVGDPEAEASWLEAAGVTSADGFGWLGPDGSSTPLVQVVDRHLLVDGLEWREAYEPEPTVETQEPPDPEAQVEPEAYGAPLALALERSATSVLVEGDRGGEGAIAFDLVCIGDQAELLTLGQDLADAPYARPERAPWIGPALTIEERRARRTERLVAQLWAAAFIQDVMRSDEMERLSQELARATEAGDSEAVASAQRAMQSLLAELVPRNLPDLGSLADALDPDQVIATMAELSAGATEPETDAEAGAGTGRDGGAAYEILADGRRLWVTRASWFGIAQGFAPFVRHLEANGCDDIQVVFHDYDDVRGD